MRNIEILLAEISESLDRIARKAEGRTFAAFREDADAQDVVCWHVTRIGEAVKQESVEFTRKHPEIPWKQMAGMRDVLIHQYHRIDIREVWRTASMEAEPLKRLINACIGDTGWRGTTSGDVRPVVRETRSTYRVGKKKRKKR